MGSLRGGHYTATVLSNEDKTWYELDDTRVRKVIVKSIYVARMKHSENAIIKRHLLNALVVVAGWGATIWKKQDLQVCSINSFSSIIIYGFKQ